MERDDSILVEHLNGNPFEGFPYGVYEPRIEGWNYLDPAFEELILEVKPKLIIEIGTWLGASAIRMAGLCQYHKIDAQVVCVDTWLGSPEMFTFENLKEARKMLNPVYGYPQVYHQFLANVMWANCQKIIVPYQQDSHNASIILGNIQADLIYLDGAHDYDAVKRDLGTWFPKVREGGIIFGDDIDWASVRDAVFDYCIDEKQVMEHKGTNKWVIRK